jgi:hypothetical protein
MASKAIISWQARPLSKALESERKGLSLSALRVMC